MIKAFDTDDDKEAVTAAVLGCGVILTGAGAQACQKFMEPLATGASMVDPLNPKIYPCCAWTIFEAALAGLCSCSVLPYLSIQCANDCFHVPCKCQSILWLVPWTPVCSLTYEISLCMLLSISNPHLACLSSRSGLFIVSSSSSAAGSSELLVAYLVQKCWQVCVCVRVMQVLNGGAPCQQVDSEEDDDQEAEVEDEVSCC